MQGTRVQDLVQEDSTKPVSPNYWAHVLWLLKPAELEPVLCNKRSHRDEKLEHHKEEKLWLPATRENLHTATKTQHSQR